jgi:hypothetical protein
VVEWWDSAAWGVRRYADSASDSLVTATLKERLAVRRGPDLGSDSDWCARLVRSRGEAQVSQSGV